MFRSTRRRSIGASVSVSKRIHRLFGAGDLGADHQFEILDPDAVSVGLVVAGLVGKDHAALERRGAELGNPRRSFMDRKIAADAVAGAVLEIEPGLPQELPRQRVELRAGGAVRKHRARDRDVAAQHAGKAVAHFRRRLADRDGAGDVGGAVFVLRAGIDQQEIAGRDPPVALAGDAVVHDRAVRTGAGDGRERDVLQRAGVAAEALQRLDGVDLGQRAGGRLRGRSRPESAPAPPHRADARSRVPSISVAILDGLEQADRIVAAHRLAACARYQPAQRVGGARAVERDRCAALRQLGEFRRQRVRLLDIGRSFEMVAGAVGEFAVIDEDGGTAVLRHQRVGQRQRRVRDVGAADIEGPRHRVRVRQHQRVGAELCDFACGSGSSFSASRFA